MAMMATDKNRLNGVGDQKRRMEAKLDAAPGCLIIKGRGWNTGDKDKWQLCVEGCTLPVNRRLFGVGACALRDGDVKVRSRW